MRRISVLSVALVLLAFAMGSAGAAPRSVPTNQRCRDAELMVDLTCYPTLS